MTTRQIHQGMRNVFNRAVAPRFNGTVSDWAEQFVCFNEPGRVGRFSLRNREYLREPLDCYGQDEVTDLVLCFGTRTGKTTVMFAGTAFRVKEKARRVLYVKPTTKGTAGAEGDARTRFIPMLRASPALAELIPVGAMRHNFKTAQQMLRNGSIIDWTGSNSVANLASNSMEDVNQDEVDKFNSTRRKDESGETIEANASDLADERTGEFRNPKRVKSSTPTLATGRIWSELGKTDLRRRFVPCPLCGRDHPASKRVVIAWSDNFTILPRVFGYGTPYEPGAKIPLAVVAWDKEAKKADGTWDLERVEKSAGYTCPHCGGRFRDDAKTWQDANGVWIPTQLGAPRSRGYQLPSMYSSHEQTTAGRLALDFIEGVHSVEGPRNFINSKLSEPYGQQDIGAKRIEAVSAVEVGSEWKKLMTVDCQAKAPHFWHIIRAYGGKEIVGLKGGSLDTWDDVRSAQTGSAVIDAGVIVDSGYGAKDDAEVYRVCASYGELMASKTAGKALHLGWMPAKGMPGRRRWRDPSSGLFVPWYYRPTDPYIGTADAGQVTMDLFEFARDYFNDVLERLRYNKAGGIHWTISQELNTDEYHLHMRGQVKREVVKAGVVIVEWQKRYAHAPDHMRSCEIMQVAGAMALGLLEVREETGKEQTK